MLRFVLNKPSASWEWPVNCINFEENVEKIKIVFILCGLIHAITAEDFRYSFPRGFGILKFAILNLMKFT